MLENKTFSHPCSKIINFFSPMLENKKFFLTKEGLTRLEKEYRDLEKLILFKSKGEALHILHSEEINPEYLVLQEDLGLLEARIVDLETIIKNAQLIVPPVKQKQNVVDLGAQVTVEANGRKEEFEIVGSLEADPSSGKISYESLVGRSLLGRKAGEQVSVQSPTEKTVYKILKIKY